MSDNQTILQWALIGLAFRAMLVICSALFGYWGYRLFKQGIYDEQGELKA